MTYEERKQKVCDNCDNHKNICGYRCRQLNDKCEYLQAVMEGWELGKEDIISKTCEWIEALNNEHLVMSFTDSHTLETDELIQYFKNFMED